MKLVERRGRSEEEGGGSHWDLKEGRRAAWWGVRQG